MLTPPGRDHFVGSIFFFWCGPGFGLKPGKNFLPPCAKGPTKKPPAVALPSLIEARPHQRYSTCPNILPSYKKASDWKFVLCRSTTYMSNSSSVLIFAPFEGWYICRAFCCSQWERKQQRLIAKCNSLASRLFRGASFIRILPRIIIITFVTSTTIFAPGASPVRCVQSRALARQGCRRVSTTAPITPGMMMRVHAHIFLMYSELFRACTSHMHPLSCDRVLLVKVQLKKFRLSRSPSLPLAHPRNNVLAGSTRWRAGWKRSSCHTCTGLITGITPVVNSTRRVSMLPPRQDCLPH